MNVERTDDGAVPRLAAAIGEPARARMLYALLDDRARTSTELAMIGGVNPSTASAHLNRLSTEHLVKVLVQGKHRYYSLAGADVAGVLESLSVLAGGARIPFVPNTPNSLRAARTCYDHLAGTIGVMLHDRLESLGLLSPGGAARADSCELTPKGVKAFESLGVDVERARASRRRFAFSCLDWSERRAHLGGALGAAFLSVALKKQWFSPVRGNRALSVTTLGSRELAARFGIRL
jgi:DNA-binding transcriptional ArsR family regulator